MDRLGNKNSKHDFPRRHHEVLAIQIQQGKAASIRCFEVYPMPSQLFEGTYPVRLCERSQRFPTFPYASQLLYGGSVWVPVRICRTNSEARLQSLSFPSHLGAARAEISEHAPTLVPWCVFVAAADTPSCFWEVPIRKWGVTVRSIPATLETALDQ